MSAGFDAVTGLPYAAGDPALLLWVHVTLVQSSLAAGQAFGTPVPAGDSDRYVAEMVAAAELVGVPRALVPATVADLERYVASVRPGLSCTPAASESMAYLLDPPGLDDEVAGFWHDVRDAAIAMLPDWAREMYGYHAPPLSPGRRMEIRQSLGVLDAMFLGEPGACSRRGSGSPCGCARRGRHEGQEARRRGDGQRRGRGHGPGRVAPPGADRCAWTAGGRRCGS